MQTSAQTSAHQSVSWPDAQYTGTLLHHAQARTTVLDNQGHTVPVLCMEVELDTLLHTPMRVEQPYPAGQFAQCELDAKQLKAGMRVTVQAPLIGIRLVAKNATRVTVLPDASTATDPITPTPDLFQE